MKQHRPTIHYSIIQALYYALYGSSISSTSLFLLHKGFSNSQIGAVIAFGGLLSAFVQPVLGKIADRAKRSILRRLITCNCIVCIVLIGFILAPFTGPKILTVMYIVLIAAVQSIIPMCSALAMFYSDRGVKVDFGIGRGFGSFGFAVCIAMVGSLAAVFSPEAAMYVSLAIALLLILATATFRFKGVSEINSHRTDLSASEDSFLKEHKSFIPVMLGVMLLIINHTTFSNFMLQIVKSKGGTSVDMGHIMALAAFMEVPALLLLRVFNRYFPSGVLFRFSTVFFCLRTVLMILAPGMPLFYLAHLCQFPGYGLYAGSSVYYVNHTIEKSSQVRGQAYLNMMHTAASIIGCLAGGRLLDASSVNVLLVSCLACGITGTILLQLSVKRGLKVGEE